MDKVDQVVSFWTDRIDFRDSGQRNWFAHELKKKVENAFSELLIDTDYFILGTDYRPLGILKDVCDILSIPRCDRMFKFPHKLKLKVYTEKMEVRAIRPLEDYEDIIFFHGEETKCQKHLKTNQCSRSL
jgi:hypothetical protein